jgi:type IV pilus assembly protein PilP
MMRRLLIMSITCLGLVSCGSEQYSDLKDFVKKSDELPRGRIPPLPDVKPYEPFAYEAFDLLDPFKQRKMEAKAAAGGGGLQPDLARAKEPLEAYPLENLRMVGTLQQNKATFALVRSPDNNLFRVKLGNYMGQNFGLITDISESAIKLKEIIQDSGGDWAERISTMTLIDEGSK